MPVDEQPAVPGEPEIEGRLGVPIFWGVVGLVVLLLLAWAAWSAAGGRRRAVTGEGPSDEGRPPIRRAS